MNTKRSIPFAVKQMIQRRRLAKMARERRQLDLIGKEDLWHNTIAGKLESLGVVSWERIVTVQESVGIAEEAHWKNRYPWLDNFMECGTKLIIRICRCCGQREQFHIACSQKWCPRCSWKISKRREEKLAAWTKRVQHPQHLVLTQKNFPTLTRGKIKQHLGNLQKFRRSKAAASIKGGCVTVEITNNGNGWHLHSHWLIDADELNPREISVTWGKLVGQEFAIVKVKPVAATDYLSELCKYVAKGSEIASWEPEQIWEFTTAIRGRRFFFTFGSLTKLAAEVRAEILFLKPESPGCDCGSHDFKFTPPGLQDF